jgi:transcriptional regulator with XRE-family HTH domain
VTRTVAQVIGTNVRNRRLTAGISLDTLAASSPLLMSTGRIGNIESARSATTTLESLIAMAIALSRTTAEPVTLVDLLDGEGQVSLGDQFTIELSTLQAVLRGQPVPILDAENDRKLGEVMTEASRMAITRLPEWTRLPQSVRRNLDPHGWLRVKMTLRESDTRMCKAIGVDRELGAALMTQLWGKPFSEERDHRAGSDTNAQHKGQISRQLKADLEKAITT